MPKPKERDIELMFEISAFRNFPRAWIHWLGPNTANHAEHSFRTALYALMISLAEGKGNHERILKMALLHDLPESRCTDVDYVQRLYVARNEQLAIDDIFEGTVMKAEAQKILKEYHERKTIEAKIVKDADLIDADIELRERITQGATMHAKHIADRTKGVIPRMFTKTAKEMFAKIHKADPNDWHRKALHNRFNGGDWMKETKK